MLAAAHTLQLDEAQRRRTILRIDAGAGSVEDINWALARVHQVHGKDYSGQRARILADSVTEWVDDPQVPGRPVGWVRTEATMYVRPVRRLAVRCRKQNGQWDIGVIVSAPAPPHVLALAGQPQMVMWLDVLAPNVLIWTRRWLVPNDAKLAHYGLLRLVRDVFHIRGCIQRDTQGRIVQILLNQASPLARNLALALQALLPPAHVAVTSGEI
jgi:hypothetical protein